ncbi:MAG: hypothetical protein JSW34_05535 [Candidatus Zixiibacteriota bacterium]|nr:MAG: hypothetical protein JSW34_05535 [candidate division Zixibacteria bacterium]
MNKKISDHVLLEFSRLIKQRNFLPFSELCKHLGLTQAEIIRIKGELEDYLRREDPKARLVSRVDLDPPGFEIEC